jgi:hypothetical protein
MQRDVQNPIGLQLLNLIDNPAAMILLCVAIYGIQQQYAAPMIDFIAKSQDTELSQSERELNWKEAEKMRGVVSFWSTAAGAVLLLTGRALYVTCCAGRHRLQANRQNADIHHAKDAHQGTRPGQE